MPRTYRAILRGERLEWVDPPPERAEAIPIHVTLPEEPAERARPDSARAVAALQALADIGGIRSIPDPLQWQRDVR